MPTDPSWRLHVTWSSTSTFIPTHPYSCFYSSWPVKWLSKTGNATPVVAKGSEATCNTQYWKSTQMKSCIYNTWVQRSSDCRWFSGLASCAHACELEHYTTTFLYFPMMVLSSMFRKKTYKHIHKALLLICKFSPLLVSCTDRAQCSTFTRPLFHHMQRETMPSVLFQLIGSTVFTGVSLMLSLLLSQNV